MKPLIQDIIRKKQPIKTEKTEPEKKKKPSVTFPAEQARGKQELEISHFKFPRLRFGFLRQKSKFKLILGIGALTGLILGVSIILLDKFSSIIVEITPRQQYIDVNAVFNASINPQKDDLPLEVMQLSREEEGTAAATGKKQVSHRASGQIVIYNSFSSEPQNLISNTRFETPDGKIYRIDKPITIPGAKIEGGKITPSEIEVTVYADKPGEEYNIGLTDFTIPGFKDPLKRQKIYARSKTEMKGGFTGEVKIITANDIETLKSSLREKIKNYLLTVGINPKPEEFILYDDAKKIIFSSEEEKFKIGEESDLLELKEKGTLYGYLLKKKDISSFLAAKYLGPEIASRVELINADKLIFEIKKFSPQEISFQLKGQGQFVWKFDENSIKNTLILERQNPTEAFSKYPFIEKAKIIFKPSWWRHIPKKTEQISIHQILRE